MSAELPEWDPDPVKRLGVKHLIAGQELLASKIDIDTFDLSLSLDADMPPEIYRPSIIQPIPARPEEHELPPVNDTRKLIPQWLVSRYFDAPIHEGIHDPQSILSNKEHVETQVALENYAQESPVSIYFYLFEKNQRVPQTQSPQVTFNQFYYSEPSAVIVYYFMGEPERSQLYFGGKDANLVATNKIRELTASIRNGAKRRSNRSSQLNEFIKQLSRGMYWIEKSMVADVYLPLDLNGNTSKQTSGGASKLSEKAFEGVSKISNVWWIIVIVSVLVIVVLLLGVYWVSNRRFLFPRLSTHPRLSLPHGGSSGGVLRFDKENVPPSAQREQFDNPL